VQIDDHIRIRPGEQIPVDARVLEEHGYIDESMLTGEPVPANKTIGDTVSGGTLNKSGSLLVTAERAGSETALSRIIEMIKQAQYSKPDIAPADVGFAIGNDTDIAIESADMVLIRNSLHSVADAIELSKARLKISTRTCSAHLFIIALGYRLLQVFCPPLRAFC
jgi:cation transport ATPase